MLPVGAKRIKLRRVSRWVIKLDEFEKSCFITFDFLDLVPSPQIRPLKLKCDAHTAMVESNGTLLNKYY